VPVSNGFIQIITVDVELLSIVEHHLICFNFPSRSVHLGRLQFFRCVDGSN
jgi:hypothetical protein